MLLRIVNISVQYVGGFYFIIKLNFVSSFISLFYLVLLSALCISLSQAWYTFHITFHYLFLLLGKPTGDVAFSVIAILPSRCCLAT
jgi:hypothetical protein